MGRKFQSTCRACGAETLTPLFSLGGDDAFVLCDPSQDGKACGLVQRAEAADIESRRPVPATQTDKHRQRSLVAEVMEMLSTRDGRALDIGCGDGSLQAQFPRWIETFGTNECANLAVNADAMTGRFPGKSLLRRLKVKAGEGGFDVITCVDEFAATNNAKEFLAASAELLAYDGVFVLETPYLSLALMRNDVGQFNQRAQGIYTLSVLEKLANEAGLKIVRGAMSETAGGSLRLFMCHQDYDGFDFVPWLDQLARLWDEEASLNLVSRQPYQAMLQRISINHQYCDALVREMQRYGEDAAVLGADERMIKMIQSYEIPADIITAIVDNHYVGDDLGAVVISEAESREAPPDIYFAPSWRRREILETWRESIFSGARIVFLSPDYEVVSRENYATALGKCLAVTDAPGSVETLRSVLRAVHRPHLVAVNTNIKRDKVG